MLIIIYAVAFLLSARKYFFIIVIAAVVPATMMAAYDITLSFAMELMMTVQESESSGLIQAL